MYRIQLYIVPEDSDTCQGMRGVKNSNQSMNIHKVFNFINVFISQRVKYYIANTECLYKCMCLDLF